MYTTRENTKVASFYSYDEWGNPRNNPRHDINQAGLDGSATDYTGYDYDVVLEKYFAQARFYDSANKRFVARDPVKDGKNWYGYCGNDPVNWIDPLGYRGQVVFMQHGLNANHEEFEATVIGLKEMQRSNGKNKFISLGINTAGRSVEKGGRGSKKMYYNGVYQKCLTDTAEKNRGKSIHEIRAIFLDNLTADGTHVLIRTEFSAGNMSFEDQRLELKSLVEYFGNFKSDVTFIGHSMGGLASINYGIDYADANPGKKVNIITVSTPYHPNSVAAKAAKGEKVVSLFQDIGPAHSDLGGLTNNLEYLVDKWNHHKRNGGETTAYAISIAKAGRELTYIRDQIGDGVVDVYSQQSREVLIDQNISHSFEHINRLPLIIGNGISVGTDLAETDHPYHHVRTPDLQEVIDQINGLFD